MSVMAIFIGAPPNLSDIPCGCWAEKVAGHKGWAIINSKGARTAVEVTPGNMQYWYDGAWHPYPKGDTLSVTATARREEVEKMAAKFFNEMTR